jgi:hypothetical protein
MNRHYIVSLPDTDRQHLETLIRSGNAPARTHTRARILLLTDTSQGRQRLDREIAGALGCSPGTLVNVRRRYLQAGLKAALYDRPRPGAKPKITGDIEAQMTLLVCSDPPEGQARWTLRLLADRMVALELVESLSHVAVWERMKKN